MKKAILIVIVVGMLGWAVYEFVSSTDKSLVQGNDNTISDTMDESDQIGINEGDIAPDFELTTLDGKVVRLSDYRGQPVMLNFWGSWCPPCRSEMPDMQKFYEKKDVAIVAVNLLETESNPDDVQKFADEFGLTFTIPLDEQSAVSQHYEIIAYPTTLMINSSGRIHSRFRGAINYDMMVQEFEMMK
ncbi:redoxin domain-containing protein [Paenibacillus sp. CMAA1364]